MRTWLLILHVIGAGTWLGANLTQAVAMPGFVRKGGEAAVQWWRTTAKMGKVLYPPAGVVILVTGVLLVTSSNGGYTFADPFVSVGFAAVIIGAVLGITYFGPRGERAAARRAEGDEAGAEPIEGGIARMGAVDTAVVVVAIVAMVSRWGV